MVVGSSCCSHLFTRPKRGVWTWVAQGALQKDGQMTPLPSFGSLGCQLHGNKWNPHAISCYLAMLITAWEKYSLMHTQYYIGSRNTRKNSGRTVLWFMRNHMITVLLYRLWYDKVCHAAWGSCCYGLGMARRRLLFSLNPGHVFRNFS